MGLVGDLIGLIVSGGVAAGGKISYENNRRKKAKAVAEAFNRKQTANAEKAILLYDASPKDTSGDLCLEIEKRIGCSLKDAEQESRQYNLVLEYALALDRIDSLRNEFLRKHPPGSVLHVVRRSMKSTDASGISGAKDYVPLCSDCVLPEDEDQWAKIVHDEFWRHEYTSFVGPGYTGGRKTYGVSAGLYALGQARIDVAAAGFLPSNCEHSLWPYWNPYIKWDGVKGIMSNRFNSSFDIADMIPNAYYIHILSDVHTILSQRVLDNSAEVRKKQEAYEYARRIRPDLYP